MKKGLVTIVLPIYNVENYLDKCLESIVDQTYKNLEIICVDDGSTDHSPQICEEWAVRDERVMVIHQENAGLGMARNTGIEYAQGEYICFFDSDDYVALDLIEKAYELAEKECAELVIWGFRRVKDGKVITERIPTTEKSSYTGNEVQDKFLPDLIGEDLCGRKNANLAMGAWSIMCSMSVIKRSGWRWASERIIISEDTYSVLCLCSDIGKVAVLREALYYYVERKGSTTQRYQKDRYKKQKECIDVELKTSEKLGYNDEVKRRLLYGHISCVLYAMQWIIKSDISSRRQYQELKTIIEDAHLQNILDKLDFTNASLHKRIMLFSVKKKWSLICFVLLIARVKMGQ